jgi:hypothetical protein
MKKIFMIIGAIITVIIGFYFYLNFKISNAVSAEINSDTRNEGIKIDVHYKNYISLNTLVFNLTDVTIDKAPADVFRVFLQSASALMAKQFEKVELEFNGKSKFYIMGDYFKKLGDEFEKQNPVFTMRTFPENLYTTNGEAAYETWEGGALGVFSKQINDFSDFNKKWYSEDLLKESQQ